MKVYAASGYMEVCTDGWLEPFDDIYFGVYSTQEKAKERIQRFIEREGYVRSNDELNPYYHNIYVDFATFTVNEFEIDVDADIEPRRM